MKMNRRNALITGTALAVGITQTGSPEILAGLQPRLTEGAAGQDIAKRIREQAASCRNLSATCETLTDDHASGGAELQRVNLDCADICSAALAILERQSSVSPALLQACADACQRQLDLLENLKVGRLRSAAQQVARQCADACRSAIG